MQRLGMLAPHEIERTPDNHDPDNRWAVYLLVAPTGKAGAEFWHSILTGAALIKLNAEKMFSMKAFIADTLALVLSLLSWVPSMSTMLLERCGRKSDGLEQLAHH